MTDVLSPEGYEVEAVADGQIAVDLIDGEQFDLVVTDMMMPGVNGVEVLLAAKRVDSQYPVIIITGYPSVDMAVRLVKLGATDYIAKPFNVDIIKITVAKVLTMSELSKKALGSYGSDMPATGLTEPYKPAVFDQFLEKEVARAELYGRGCCLLVARIDDFDNLPRGGLTARGSRLKTFARVLEQQVRTADVVGRTGVSELSVLLPETAKNEAKALGHAIASEMKSNFTISVGVASYPRDASDSRSLLEAARAGWETGG